LPVSRPQRLRTVQPVSPADPDPAQNAQRRLAARFALADGMAAACKGRLLDITA